MIRKAGMVCIATIALMWSWCLTPATRAADEATAPPSATPAIHVAHEGLKKLGWQLAVPTGTFQDRTAFEAIDLLHSLNIHHLELTPGQPLSADQPNVVVGPQIPDAAIKALLAKLKSVHMDIVSYGPVTLISDDAAGPVTFAFAKRLKAKDVVASAPAPNLPQLDKLANETGINLALRNSAGLPNDRTPADLLSVLSTLPGHAGSCDCLGEWLAAGVDPATATRQLRGHIVQVRVDDIDASRKPTVIGAGKVDVRAVLSELAQQKFQGVIVAVCTPGRGEEVVDRFVRSINALSDAVTKVAEANDTPPN